MTMPQTNMEMMKFIRIVDLLMEIPDVNLVVIPNRDRICCFCQDQYDINAWQRGGKIDRPVKFNCGHVVGFQCLVRWIISSDFKDRCPLCRSQIMVESHESSSAGWELASRLLGIAALIEHRPAKADCQVYLEMIQPYTESTLWTSSFGVYTNRAMAISEEYLTLCCKSLSAGKPKSGFDVWAELDKYGYKRRRMWFGTAVWRAGKRMVTFNPAFIERFSKAAKHLFLGEDPKQLPPDDVLFQSQIDGLIIIFFAVFGKVAHALFEVCGFLWRIIMFVCGLADAEVNWAKASEVEYKNDHKFCTVLTFFAYQGLLLATCFW